MSRVSTTGRTARVMQYSSVLAVLSPCLLVALRGPAAAQDEAYQPLSLEDCIRLALENNPQLVSSQQGITRAQAGVTRTRSSYYPDLSLTAVQGVTSQQTSPSLGGGTVSPGGSDTRQELDLDVGIALWRSGRSDSVAQSRSELKAAQMSHRNTAQLLAEQVATHYYGVLAAKELVAVAEAGVESAQQHLHDVQTRIKLGDAAEVDVFTAEDDVAQAELDLIDRRSGVRSALAGLKYAMGLPYSTDLDLAEAPMVIEEAIPTLAEAVAAAMATRPDVLASEASLKALKRALGQAKTQRGVTLDVSGGYNQGYSDFDSRNPSWDVLATVSWPLFDGYARKADETSARADLKRAEADLQELANQIALQAEDALVALDRSRERLEATGKSVAAADARLRAAQSKYRQGVGILLEVTDARAASTSAAADRVRARFDYQVALVGLQRAMGTLPLPTPE